MNAAEIFGGIAVISLTIGAIAWVVKDPMRAAKCLAVSVVWLGLATVVFWLQSPDEAAKPGGGALSALLLIFVGGWSVTIWLVTRRRSQAPHDPGAAVNPPPERT